MAVRQFGMMRVPSTPPDSVLETIEAVARRRGSRIGEKEFWVTVLEEASRAQSMAVGDSTDFYDEFFLYDSSIPTRLWDVIADDHSLGIELAALLAHWMAGARLASVAGFLLRDAARAAGMIRYRSGDTWMAFETVEKITAWAATLGVTQRVALSPFDHWLGTTPSHMSPLAVRGLRHSGVEVEPRAWSSLVKGAAVVVPFDDYYDHLLAVVEVASVGEVRLFDLETGATLLARATPLTVTLGCVNDALRRGEQS